MSVTKIDHDLILNVDDDVIQYGRRACAVRGAKETLKLLPRLATVSYLHND